MRGMSAATLGIADLPMRLLVAAIVTSVAVPVLWSSYSDLSTTMTERYIEKEIRDMFEVVQEVMDGGYGTRVKFTIELETWGGADLEHFTIGSSSEDPGNKDRYIVSYKIEGYGRGFMSLDPPVALVSLEGIGLSAGHHELWLEHKLLSSEEVCWIEMV
jgi:hypothetical protein